MWRKIVVHFLFSSYFEIFLILKWPFPVNYSRGKIFRSFMTHIVLVIIYSCKMTLNLAIMIFYRSIWYHNICIYWFYATLFWASSHEPTPSVPNNPQLLFQPQTEPEAGVRWWLLSWPVTSTPPSLIWINYSKLHI